MADATNDDMTDELLTGDEVAARCRVAKSTVFRWVKAGTLPAIVISPKVIRFRDSDVEALLSRAAS